VNQRSDDLADLVGVGRTARRADVRQLELGTIFDRDGHQVATVSQEVLLRPRRAE
jgi:acyl-CoA thioesterase